MVARAGEAASFPFLVHSHMLRHSCGYKLANDGQDTRAIQHYLGHKSINSTVRYTALASDRFKGLLEGLAVANFSIFACKNAAALLTTVNRSSCPFS
jgi:site-specific recombinase XerD